MENGFSKILLTFDVELFFGQKSGTLENCIIEPSERILKQLEKSSAVGTFFIDASYLLFLKEYSLKDNLKKIELLINRIESANCEVGLHIHPHWIDASYSKMGNCQFNSYNNYSINSFAGSYYEYCMRAHDLLSEYLNGPSIKSFRAGGYCSQPFCEIEKVFQKTDISIDSSVVPLFKSSTEPFSFDYTNIAEAEPYRFEKDNTVLDNSGKNLELPVSCIEMSGPKRIYEKIKRIGRSKKKFGDGSGLRFDNKFLNRFKKVRKVLTLDDCSSQEINSALKKLNYANVVSHPKNFTLSSLNILNSILNNSSYLFFRCRDDF